MRGSRLLVVAALALVACVSSGCSTLASSRTDLESAPIATVLMMDGPTSELVVVDLETFKIARRIRLRSLTTSIDGDPRSRTVVTAQSGQPHDHDTACGIVDVPSGRVRYVDTKLPNPDNVTLLGDTAYIVHGLQEDDHLVTSVVDIRARSLVANGGASDRAGQLAAAAGSPLVPVSKRTASEAWTAAPGGLQRLDSKGNGHWIARLPYRSVTILGEREGKVIVVGSIERDGGFDWAISVVNPVTGVSEKQVPLRHIDKGIIRGCVGKGEIYLADENGLDPGNVGNTVIVLDAESLQEKRRFTVPGSPADVDLWGNRVLVSDGKTGELLLYEPGAQKPAKRLKITDSPLLAADTLVFAEGAEQLAFDR